MNVLILNASPRSKGSASAFYSSLLRLFLTGCKVKVHPLRGARDYGRAFELLPWADAVVISAPVYVDVWGVLMSMKSLCGEPVSMWLPEKYKKPNTSTYVQGVEVETDYMGMIPEGFDTIHLPEAEYLMFQGQPFREEDYCEAIRTVQAAMDSYDPSVVGYRWDDENPRIQLEPRGQRGYIELRAVRRIQK